MTVPPLFLQPQNSIKLLLAILLSASLASCSDDHKATSDSKALEKSAHPDVDSSNTKEEIARKNSASRTANELSSTQAHGIQTKSAQHLPSESGFIFNQGISSQEAQDLLQSNRSMSSAISKITQEAASSPEAQDLAEHYRASLTRAIGKDGILEQLSCGLSICIGMARTQSEDQHEAWNNRLAADRSSPMYSYVESLENVGGTYENRFIFSTDPSINSISGN
ncbi:hypothetical protein [Stenotrophomonas sp.]|uniref:hypothetical protein n=1 Tax=Stenotrophomonas sp. TaxID=69392 RepID=UPI002D6A4FB1|nr:hypothetical protein [Stenotrophomonas sp.]HYQ25372.1 hypothetical protein [Stenotrophomonas sp.]